MLPIFGMVSKVVIFLIDTFVSDQMKRQELKDSFYKFFKKSNGDSKVSTEIRDQYEKFKEDKSW